MGRKQSGLVGELAKRGFRLRLVPAEKKENNKNGMKSFGGSFRVGCSRANADAEAEQLDSDSWTSLSRSGKSDDGRKILTGKK